MQMELPILISTCTSSNCPNDSPDNINCGNGKTIYASLVQPPDQNSCTNAGGSWTGNGFNLWHVYMARGT